MVCLDRNNLGMLQTIRKVEKVTKRGNCSGQRDKPAPNLECTYTFVFFFLKFVSRPYLQFSVIKWVVGGGGKAAPRIHAKAGLRGQTGTQSGGHTYICFFQNY